MFTRFLSFSLLLVGLSGFGQAFTPMRPFVFQSSVPAWSPIEVPKLAYWWVASDLPAGDVTTWTDRVSGIVLSNSLVDTKPVADGTSVHFTTSYLSNTLPAGNVGIVFTMLWIAKLPAPFPAINGYLLSRNGATKAGFRPDYPHSMKDTALAAFATRTLTNGSIHDFIWQTDGAAGTTHFLMWTNGVPVATNDSASSLNWPDNLGLGNSRDRAAPLNCFIYEFLIYTNYFVDSTTISNLHYYATNTYGFSP